MIPPLVLFIVGPTASGKSDLAVALAKRMNGEVISADSMLVYQGMDIGTAKLSAKERRGVPHHGIDLVPPTKSFSVFKFRQFALKAIRDVVKNGKTPIVAGGTGFYVRALLEGLSPQPGANPAIRRKLESEAQKKGLPALYKRLLKADPERAQAIGPDNQRRIIRALEIYLVSGKKPSKSSAKTPGLVELGYQPVVIGIHRDRPALYQKINKRVDRMFRRGLVREVERLAKKKLSVTALQGVGYKEVLEFLKRNASGPGKQHPVLNSVGARSSTGCRPGVLPAATVGEVKEKIKQTTRHFAKRQWTWFKRERGIRWVWWPEGVPLADVSDYILTHMIISSRMKDGGCRMTKVFKKLYPSSDFRYPGGCDGR
ncbi:MAG TPA: tRNA (adenosine(37)-N6)-dimethylallyltransferase MiaA [Candidatus Omnitrophota bacterium]|nr:tRNA (adenosine(37)-N6)-dimethylallyltransferase MiaA [Candidatus Omnitrophota bacterium]HPS36874.1 tRNA (adenosine(37)-N6)-dimethylallyltransferase MiaA [Candidatus Omnitrophota bacterium]